MITTLEIGSIIVPTESLLEFSQDYQDLEASDFSRVADGSGILRTSWSGKLSTTITGSGWIPSAFDNVAQGGMHTIKCAVPRQVSSATTSVTLPAARRTDSGHTPIGFALVGDLLIETPITGIVANVATLTTVSGALGYRVHYWPQIVAVILRNTCRGASAAVYDWSIEAEQV